MKKIKKNQIAAFLALASFVLSVVSGAVSHAQTITIATSTIEPGPQTYPAPPVRVCPYEGILLRPGFSGSEVKALQSLLAEDRSVYPEGLATGYYGTLTTEAVKRFQRKVGLPETGIMDENTRELLFPCVTLRVVSPNGGETWAVGETRSIAWEVEAPVYILMKSGAAVEVERAAPQAATPSAPAVYPYFPNLSIDLVRADLGSVVYHVGGASLYGDRSFAWAIPQNIPESRSYKVRVSVWKYLPEPIVCTGGSAVRAPCPLTEMIYPAPWQGYLWDESDGTFAISGGGVVPPPLDYAKLKLLHQYISAAVENLQNALKTLEELLKAAQ